MSRRDTSARLRHMLDHSREAVTMAAGKARADLDRGRKGKPGSCAPSASRRRGRDQNAQMGASRISRHPVERDCWVFETGRFHRAQRYAADDVRLGDVAGRRSGAEEREVLDSFPRE
jgi:hypothetical protein